MFLNNAEVFGGLGSPPHIHPKNELLFLLTKPKGRNYEYTDGFLSHSKTNLSGSMTTSRLAQHTHYHIFPVAVVLTGAKDDIDQTVWHIMNR